MIEKIILELMKHIPWIFSGIGNMFVDQILNPLKEESQINPQQNLIIEPIETKEESYSVSLGKRHKFLREQYLKLNPRKMADFYGYEKVAELERYESGEQEFPAESLEKLKKTFFIKDSFLEEGDSFIFRTFNLYSDEVKQLLQEGFRPNFLCCTHDRSWLYTYPVFHKQENGYSRIVKANSVSSFKSTGEGYNNIAQIIKEMLRQGMDYSCAFVLKVDRAKWKKLEEGVFYSSSSYFGHGRDEECADIFYEHYQKLKDYLIKV